MSESEEATERTVVKTYVPAYQRDAWDDHADKLKMSRSEFVRSMVQAGRRGFESGAGDQGGADGDTGASEETSAGQSLESEVLEHLREGPRDWEELLSALTDDVEQRLEDTLQDLQAEGRVHYSGRDGGYVLDE